MKTVSCALFPNDRMMSKTSVKTTTFVLFKYVIPRVTSWFILTDHNVANV